MKMQLSESLNTLLATSSDFYHTYKYFHWNITGQDFYQFHLLFDAHAGFVLETIDPVGERIRQLNEEALSDFESYSKLSKLSKPRPNPKNNIQEVLEYLLNQHQSTISLIEEIIDSTSKLPKEDFATADLLTGFLQKHQQMCWFIQSSILT